MDTFSPEPFGSATMQALALANTEAFANWMALCQETWVRAAAVRNPLEYAAIGSLMLPACASQAMLYCKRISDIAACAQAASVPHPAPGISTPASAIEVPVSTLSNSTVTDSPDVTHAQTPSTRGAAKRSIPVPRFRGE
ncbi:hypothetical protein G3N95_04815 [Paraburkholderia sp. Tr-20389]|uniref:hypothetical protein n=1 Tax=Paraburkholderia sp. Tr-20389 TaxID=2703903 RepID=UPI00198100EB|nr:hypothetical protein [Paraburkholderia sp. Tr-20389]MBN3752250.1 hypothetical protein [Paraburkholderia sp. Tr-20389]